MDYLAGEVHHTQQDLVNFQSHFVGLKRPKMPPKELNLVVICKLYRK